MKFLAMCSEDLKRIFFEESFNPYIDSTGRPGSGSLRDNLIWLGDYEQCDSLQGSRYCLVDLESTLDVEDTTSAPSGFIPVPKPLRWGVCVPSICSEADVTKYAANILHNLTGGLSLRLQLCQPDVHCQIANNLDFGFFAIVGCVMVLAALCVLASVSEALEGIHHDADAKGAKALLQCWSIRRNVRRIFRLSDVRGEGTPCNVSLSCFHGIRVINTCWVVLGHVFLGTYATGFLANPRDTRIYTESLAWQPIGNAYFAIHTFFLLSGCMVSYTVLSAWKKGHRISALSLYIHRYLRLTPAMGMMMCVWMFVKPHLGGGPLWYGMASDPLCDRYWWTNLLYIQNFYPASLEEECNGWTWYLAMDMQMYLLAPLLILTLKRSAKCGILLALVLVASSTIVTGLIITNNNIDTDLTGMVVAGQFHAAERYETLVYGKPYCRLGPYIFGILLGYMLAEEKPKRGKTVSTYLWPSCLVTMGALLWFWYIRDRLQLADWMTLTYACMSPSLWAAALAVFLVACVRAETGFAGAVLGWPGWAPVSRLTYSIYLVHPLIIFVTFHSRKSPVVLDNWHIWSTFSGVLSLALLVGTVLALLVEIPLQNMATVLYTRAMPPHDKVKRQ